MIDVLVVDDHALIRKGLKQILEDTHDIRVTGEAETGMQAITMAHENRYDIILLDITLPDKYGIDILRQLKLQCSNMPILILSMHPEDRFAMRSIKAGAAGYLSKQSAPAQLVTAIRQVASGRKYMLATQCSNPAAMNAETGNMTATTLSDTDRPA